MIGALWPLSAQCMNKIFSLIIVRQEMGYKKRHSSIVHDMFDAKIGIRLPIQLKMLISSAMASGLLARGADSMLW
jgi:hypothetical protein